MDDIFVARLMSPDVVTVTPDTLVEEAAERLREHIIGSLVVVDEDNHLRGILTSTDFVHIVAESNPKVETTVERYMTSEVITAEAQDPIRDAADKMITYKIHHLPVVDDSEGVIGMLSTADLTAYISEVEKPSPA
ncbi:MAG: CBS domain-containing protein [Haloarculaceae archaeon]